MGDLRRNRQRVPRGCRYGSSVLALALLAQGCATVPDRERAPAEEGLEDPAGPADTARVDESPPRGGSGADADPGVEILEGTGNFIRTRRVSLPAVTRTADGDIDLNFVETDVRVVIDAVLGEMLDTNYVLDQGVEGSITLQSNRSLGEAEVLAALEESLRMINLAMVRSDDTIHIVQTRDAPRRITSIRRPLPASVNLPGFGVVAVSLEYTTPEEMAKVLQPFAPEGAILSVDDSRNLILLGGTARELASLQDLIGAFDVDWIKGMSFALFTLDNVDPESMLDELESVFSDASTPIRNVVKFVPITRLNTLLAISHNREYLARVEEWVERLDKSGQTSGRKIYVYRIQNGKAETISDSLNEIFGSAVGRGPQPGGVGLPVPAGPNQPGLLVNGDPLSAQQLKIVPNTDDNSLLILATPEEYGVIQSALEQIDQLPVQVLIEATLAEVTLTNNLRYGVNWFLESGSNSYTFSSAEDGSVSPSLPGFSYLYTGSDSNSAVLNALSSITDVKVISSPKLMVLNNQTATLQVGDQVPVAVQSSQGTGDSNAPLVNTIQFRDTGVILDITPRINEGGLIILDINQEFSEVAETVSSGIDSPTIQQRRIASTIAVKNGESVALGGLIRETSTVSKSGLPLLMNIPFLGNVFSTSTDVARRTELIILITPRVLRDPRDSVLIVDSLMRDFRNLDESSPGNDSDEGLRRLQD